MIIPYIAVGSLGLVVLTVLFGPVAGSIWFAIFAGVGIALSIERGIAVLDRHAKHLEWFERLEAYRFNKQYPDAAREWREADAAKAPPKPETEAESAERTRQQLEKVEAERQAKREAKRKAAEPTFVSQELVPEIPPDFKPQSDVNFSALEEVAKPRRRRE